MLSWFLGTTCSPQVWSNIGGMGELIWSLLTPNSLVIRLILPLGGSRKSFFASGVDSRNNHLHLEIRLSTHIIGISLELKTKRIYGWKKVKTRTWMPCWNNRVQKFATFSSKPGGREQVHIFFICKDIFTWAKPKISQHLFTKISENVTHTLYSPNLICYHNTRAGNFNFSFSKPFLSKTSL